MTNNGLTPCGLIFLANLQAKLGREVSVPAGRGLFNGQVGGEPTIFMPLTGSRQRDNSLAYGVWFANQAADVFGMLSGGDDWVDKAKNWARTKSAPNRAKRKEARKNGTWHHNEIVGVMELVDKSTHADEGHSGGAYFWSVIFNKDYK